MIMWEYDILVIGINSVTTVKQLNLMGRDGWECFAIRSLEKESWYYFTRIIS